MTTKLSANSRLQYRWNKLDIRASLWHSTFLQIARNVVLALDFNAVLLMMAVNLLKVQVEYRYSSRKSFYFAWEMVNVEFYATFIVFCTMNTSFLSKKLWLKKINVENVCKSWVVNQFDNSHGFLKHSMTMNPIRPLFTGNFNCT